MGATPTVPAAERLIVALDVPDAAAALAFASLLGRDVRWLKVGLELFCAEGPTLVTKLADAGYKVMLDLKLHDIPQTVASATQRCATLGASLLTVHASGGAAMLQAAVNAAAPSDLGILAVTVLTSLDASDVAADGNRLTPAELVLARARLAQAAACAGVVSSPHEAAALRADLGPQALIVTPGIRPAGADVGDQKRVATPAAAIASGVSMIVVGRPIRDAASPAEMARQIMREMETAS